jgi:hypothetical protein
VFTLAGPGAPPSPRHARGPTWTHSRCVAPNTLPGQLAASAAWTRVASRWLISDSGRTVWSATRQPKRLALGACGPRVQTGGGENFFSSYSAGSRAV